MGMEKQKPLPADIFTDEDLIALPVAVRMTGIGLRMHADDHGRESTTLWRVRAGVWPGNPEFTDEVLTDHLLMLDDAGYIGVYSVEDRTFYQVRVWPAPSHPRPSRIPAPPLDLFQRFAGSSPAGRSAWEGESEGDESEWGESGGSLAGIPPSAFCKLHQPHGTRANCRHCGTARLAQEQWIRQHEDRVSGVRFTDGGDES